MYRHTKSWDRNEPFLLHNDKHVHQTEIFYCYEVACIPSNFSPFLDMFWMSLVPSMILLKLPESTIILSFFVGKVVVQYNPSTSTNALPGTDLHFHPISSVVEVNATNSFLWRRISQGLWRWLCLQSIQKLSDHQLQFDSLSPHEDRYFEICIVFFSCSPSVTMLCSQYFLQQSLRSYWNS